jgi:hypothetical protein
MKIGTAFPDVGIPVGEPLEVMESYLGGCGAGLTYCAIPVDYRGAG